MPKRIPRSKISVLLTKAQRVAIAEMVPEWSTRLKVSVPHQQKIPFLISEGKTILELADKGIDEMGTGVKRSPLHFVREIVSMAIREQQGIEAIPIDKRVYTFRIAIEESRPAIWRRIRVPEGTLHQFHLWLCAAMGWTGECLYRFEMNGLLFCHPKLLESGHDPAYMFDATKHSIQRIVPYHGKKMNLSYVYDFENHWVHELTFEECIEAEADTTYPLCYEGGQGCPPEKIGGIHGYYDCLESLADPHDPRHESFKAWIPKIDIHSFDPRAKTLAMQNAKHG